MSVSKLKLTATVIVVSLGTMAFAYGMLAVLQPNPKSEDAATLPTGPRWNGSSRLKSNTTAEDMRRRADDSSAAREKRAEAIFALFANHIKVPQGAADVAKVLAEATWLKDADLFGCYMLAGQVPVEWTLEDTVFCLHLFPRKNESPDWVIYFRLSGGSGRTIDEARAFLRGADDLKGAPKLVEFALCFPPADGKRLGRIERFSEKGIAVFEP
jgi:hypothetical protein